MNLHEKRIYRGIANKYKDFPITVSAMRKNEIDYLEKCFSDEYGIELLNKYKMLIFELPPSKIALFKSIGNNVAWSWFLSSCHMILAAKDNPELLKPLQNLTTCITAFENMILTNRMDLPFSLYKDTFCIFSNDEKYDIFTTKAISNTSVSQMVYGYEYFQHINYDLRGELPYNPYPTMVLDWTSDVEVANEFSFSNNEFGIIISVNYSKYKQLLYDEWYEFLLHPFVAESLPGFTPYFDFNFLFSKNNINMQNQKGFVLFWPWEYSVSELLQNELGRKLDFKLLHTF